MRVRIPRFQMSTNHSVINVVNLWKIALKKKRVYFDIIFTKKIFRFLKILKSLNLINSFLFINNQKWVYVRAYVTFKSVKYNLNFFKIFSTPAKKFYVSLKALKLFSKRTGVSTYLISTSSGVKTHRECLNRKKTGMLTSLSSN